jgi:BirA family biotin operon repressor/biotin-[acetyl-CoA-carboxylase] ligase
MSERSETLRILTEKKGLVSGEQISRELGVPTSAVCKAVESLKNDGYKIASYSNGGYCLSGYLAALSAEAIKSFLAGRCAKTDIRVFQDVDSTNSEAKRIAAVGSKGDLLIIADCQTAGRGRLGRSFYSPAGTGVYMSYLYHKRTDISKNVTVTAAAAVAVVRAIERLTDLKPEIKWVNDIYIAGRKVCGILTEAVSVSNSGTAQSIIIGIGINVTTDLFPDEISELAASLGVSAPDRNQLVAEITAELCGFISDLSAHAFMDDYRRCSCVLGKKVIFTRNGISHEGTAVSIGDTGGLKVVMNNGEITVLNSGEISLKTID